MFSSPTQSYVTYDARKTHLRLPYEGWLDLTYRCNNKCLHCWVWQPNSASEIKRELSFDQICKVVRDARSYGCREWFLSGGEPMLRPDFHEIFSYITESGDKYSLNTNGTLITPRIADLMRRQGTKMVAIYGADEKVHDAVTRTPGSFQACMRGMSYLREAGAGFMVQVIPMRINYHQLDDMMALAKSQSPLFRIGASWLHFSATRNLTKNFEIMRQRLTAEEVVALDPPRPEIQDYIDKSVSYDDRNDNRSCVEKCAALSRKFHIDPYGGMSLCSLLRLPEMRFSIREHRLADIWFEKIPNRAKLVTANTVTATACTTCILRSYCHNCPAYSHLETGGIGGQVDYLCEIAKERMEREQSWIDRNYRLYELAGMSIHVDSDLPFQSKTFGPALAPFRASQHGDDNIYISHRLGLPDLGLLEKAKVLYRQMPWVIYRVASSWIYLALEDENEPLNARAVAVFSDDYSKVIIYHRDDTLLRESCDMRALTMFPSDQIMMSQVLARRNGFYIHSAGMILNGQGLLFVGQSGMGKSTMVKMLKEYGEVFCDDRNIIRRWPDEYRIHGTWSHGEVPLVANLSAPLAAIIFLEQGEDDTLEQNNDTRCTVRHMLNRIIKPYCDELWWEATTKLLEGVVTSVPTYRLRFTRNKAKVVNSLSSLVGPLNKKS